MSKEKPSAPDATGNKSPRRPQELPNDRASLKKLLRVVEHQIQVVEPIRQQAGNIVLSRIDMLKGNLTGGAFLERDVEALRKKQADGIPLFHIANEYLDLESLVPPSAVPEPEFRYLQDVISRGTATPSERKRHEALSDIRLAEFSNLFNAYADALHGLHRRIFEKLGSTAKQPTQIWLTVTEAARITAINRGVISRAAAKGDFKTNGQRRRALRIDAADLVRWQMKRGQRSQCAESDEAVLRSLGKAAEG